MTKHFFTFQKVVNGEFQPLYLEIIVAGRISRQEARLIAEQEIRMWREASQCLYHVIRGKEQAVTGFPDYRFIGSN